MKGVSILLVIIMSGCFFTEEMPDEQNSWGYASPSSIGYSDGEFDRINDSIENKVYGDVKALIVVKNEKIIFENYYDDQFRERLRPIGVSSLVVTTAALGLMISDGYLNDLDTPIYKFLPQYSNVFDAEPDKKTITVRNLLNHRSGLSWNESTKLYISRDNDLNEMQFQADWAEYVIKKELGSDPNSRTATNTGSGLLLTSIMQHLLGDNDLEEYIKNRLLLPLGIEKYNWIHDPSGNLNGATGLFLTDLDFAKIGYLYMQNGNWNGLQVIDPAWVEQSIFPHVEASQFRYGYGWRRFSETSTALLNLEAGDWFFSPRQHGQFVFCDPKQKLLVMVYAENYAFGFYSPSTSLLSSIHSFLQ